MYTKKPKEMGSKLMICGLVYCLNTIIVVFSLMYACKGQCPTVYDDCKAAKTADPDSTSGIYTINPDGGQRFDVSYKI